MKTYLEQRAEEHARLEQRILAQKELTGTDYIMVPIQILAKHKDFSQHALRVIEAINKMTSTQIEGINLNPSGRTS